MPPKAKSNYAQTLRVIGQVLECLQADAFKLIFEGSKYIIRDLTEPSAQEQGNGTGEQNKIGSRFPEFRLTPQLVARMDSKGQTKRQLEEGLPQTESLANILRVAGNEIDVAGGTLLEITKSNDQQIDVVYCDLDGVTHTETLEISELYAAFVRTYLKRADRKPFSESQA